MLQVQWFCSHRSGAEKESKKKKKKSMPSYLRFHVLLQRLVAREPAVARRAHEAGVAGVVLVLTAGRVRAKGPAAVGAAPVGARIAVLLERAERPERRTALLARMLRRLGLVFASGRRRRRRLFRARFASGLWLLRGRLRSR